MGLVAEAARELRFLQESGRPISSSSILEWLGGTPTATGATVTPETALRLSAVFACVRVRSEDVAKLPLVLNQARVQGERQAKRAATWHPLYRVLHRVANPFMTAFQARETLQAHLDLRGNAYANVERDDGGRIVALWPLHPDRMARPVISEAGTLLYSYTLPSGEARGLTQAEVFHLRGLSPDGMVGYSPITLHRELVGWAMATREYGARFYGNNSTPGGLLEQKEGMATLSETAVARLRHEWEQLHRGLNNAHLVAILEGGLSYKAIGLSQRDSQYIETATFHIQDVARIFRVPPHKIGELSRATFSNIEEQEIEYVTDTLQSICERWEQQIFKDLLTLSEQATLFPKHNLNALLRGKTVDRFGAYMTAIQSGIYSPNDALELEDMNPFEGGDTHLQPSNMVPWGTQAVAPAADPPEAG